MEFGPGSCGVGGCVEESIGCGCGYSTFSLVIGFLVAFAGAAQARLAKEPSLSDRVLDSNELAGFERADVHTVKDVRAWAKIAPGALVNVAARLRFEGFVVAVREDLAAQANDQGAPLDRRSDEKFGPRQSESFGPATARLRHGIAPAPRPYH